MGWLLWPLSRAYLTARVDPFPFILQKQTKPGKTNKPEEPSKNNKNNVKVAVPNQPRENREDQIVVGSILEERPGAPRHR